MEYMRIFTFSMKRYSDQMNNLCLKVLFHSASSYTLCNTRDAFWYKILGIIKEKHDLYGIHEYLFIFYEIIQRHYVRYRTFNLHIHSPSSSMLYRSRDIFWYKILEVIENKNMTVIWNTRKSLDFLCRDTATWSKIKASYMNISIFLFLILYTKSEISSDIKSKK